MGHFIRKVKTASGATAVQIVRKEYGHIVSLSHIGSAHNEQQLALLMSLARQRLSESQQSLFANSSEEYVDSHEVIIERAVSQLLYDTLEKQYLQLGFDVLKDQSFQQLCLARLVEPTSKLDSVRVLADMGISGPNKDQVQRCLAKVIKHNYRDKLAKLCFTHASKGAGITLVLYDVTTLYFEIQKEDEDDSNNQGYRKPGMSKERRLEPQIIVGLLVDQNGFPLELHSFEGNKAETKTILPVIEAFRQRHGLINITVVADAGMLSANNLEALNVAGYTYSNPKTKRVFLIPVSSCW